NRLITVFVHESHPRAVAAARALDEADEELAIERAELGLERDEEELRVRPGVEDGLGERLAAQERFLLALHPCVAVQVLGLAGVLEELVPVEVADILHIHGESGKAGLTAEIRRL